MLDNWADALITTHVHDTQTHADAQYTNAHANTQMHNTQTHKQRNKQTNNTQTNKQHTETNMAPDLCNALDGFVGHGAKHVLRFVQQMANQPDVKASQNTYSLIFWHIQ
jgi:hypothetical protein